MSRKNGFKQRSMLANKKKKKKCTPILNYLEVDIKKVILATRGTQLWNHLPRWLMGVKPEVAKKGGLMSGNTPDSDLGLRECASFRYELMGSPVWRPCITRPFFRPSPVSVPLPVHTVCLSAGYWCRYDGFTHSLFISSLSFRAFTDAEDSHCFIFLLSLCPWHPSDLVDCF